MSTKNLPTNKILVFDIETDSRNPDDAQLKYFGAYSYITQKKYYFKGDDKKTIQQIKQMVNKHEVIVGFNHKKYDIKVMNKYGVYFQYKTLVDLWEILSPARIEQDKDGNNVRRGGKDRGGYMGLDLNSWSLENIAKALNLGELKEEDFDYNVLKKDVNEWTVEETVTIHSYTDQDINVTRELFEEVHEFFWPLTEHLSKYNIMKFNYMTSSIASVAYKIICYEAGVKETYGDSGKSFDYKGGYVRFPKKEKHVGEILCLDFKSLYPSIFRGFNLFSPTTLEETPIEDIFMGNDLFDIKGMYRSDELGKIEKTVARLYKLRQEYKKKGDSREYLIKIIINSLYGITPLPVFEQVYSRHGGEDCTYIGRTMIKYVADRFEEEGFEVLYGDTDSIYIALHDKTKEQALDLADTVDSELLDKMPFPHEDFGLGLDYEIKAMFFFKDSTGRFKKKNYVYVTKDNKLKIMGLPIKKSNASKVAKKVLHEYLEEQIIEELDCKFQIGYLKQLINHELENDLGLAAKTYKVKPLEEYSEHPSLHRQISEEYGEGVYNMIPNSEYGIGKSKHYCTVKEFEERDIDVDNIILETAYRNLEPFTIMCDRCNAEAITDPHKSHCDSCLEAIKQEEWENKQQTLV